MKIYKLLFALVLLLSCSSKPNQTTANYKTSVSGEIVQSHLPVALEPADYDFHLNWQDYGPELVDKAITENKPIILFIYKNNCLACYKMFSQTFNDVDVINLVNEYYLITRINADTYPEEAAQYLKHNNTVPSCVLLHSSGFAIFGITNYIDPVKFHNIFLKLNVALKSDELEAKKANSK